MRPMIAIGGPYFNSQRMLKQYASKAHLPERGPVAVLESELVLAY